MVTGHKVVTGHKAQVSNEKCADFNFPLFGKEIEMYLALKMEDRFERKTRDNDINNDYTGRLQVLGSNGTRGVACAGTGMDAARRRRQMVETQVWAMWGLRMRLGRQKRICRTHVYWRGNSPDLSPVLSVPLPLEPDTLPRCSPQALPPINRSVR